MDPRILDGDYISFLSRAGNQEYVMKKLDLTKIIQVVFFMCFSGYKISALDREAASYLIDYQEENGSFKNSLLSTCLCVQIFHKLNVDRSNIVRDLAIKYVLSKQNREGFWEGDHKSTLSVGWRVFSTVIILETINFVYKDLFMHKREVKSEFKVINGSSIIQPIKSFNPIFPILNSKFTSQIHLKLLLYNKIEVDKDIENEVHNG